MSKTEMHVVAYIDFLGSRKKIMKDDGTYLNQMLSLYENISKIFAPFIEDIKLRIFSDNIVFARKITDNEENRISNLNNMTSIAAAIQFFAILHSGSLVKGGITFGEFYADNLIVWGKGLVEAYELESDKNHVMPTIVLGGEAKVIAENNLQRLQMVCKETSGDLIIDYMQFKGVDEIMMNMHRQAINGIASDIFTSGLQEGSISDSLMLKLKWLNDYHNQLSERAI